jgi:choloylglycine hydrolase
MKSISRFKNIVIAAAILVAGPAAEACTGICLTAGDGTVVPARTMEFGVNLQSNIIVVPRGYTYVGETTSGVPGMTWKTKYGYVGANAMGAPIIADGLNEKGLYAGLFYLPDVAEYQNDTKADARHALASHQLAAYILGNFATVAEVRKALPHLVVTKAKFKPWHFMLPLHVRVYDASGKGIVIEYTKGKLHIYDNWAGVLTNSPAFPWHLTNLRNYVNLMNRNVKPVTLNGHTLTPIGEGSGLLGIPGDYTPPARFVRAVALTQGAHPGADARATVEQAFHVLNAFDIPVGAIRSTEFGKPYDDYTIWTTAVDTRHLKFYFHTHENRNPKVVDLKKFNLDAKKIVTIPMSTPQVFEDVSHQRE